MSKLPWNAVHQRLAHARTLQLQAKLILANLVGPASPYSTLGAAPSWNAFQWRMSLRSAFRQWHGCSLEEASKMAKREVRRIRRIVAGKEKAPTARLLLHAVQIAALRAQNARSAIPDGDVATKLAVVSANAEAVLMALSTLQGKSLRPVDLFRVVQREYLLLTGWELTGDPRKPWRKPSDQFPVRRSQNDAVHLQMIYDDVDEEIALEAAKSSGERP